MGARHDPIPSILPRNVSLCSRFIGPREKRIKSALANSSAIRSTSSDRKGRRIRRIVEYNAKFFVNRFASKRWSILTPERCAHWDGRDVRFTDGVDNSDARKQQTVEALWLNNYKNIFNPALVKVHATQAEMPKKY